ncbi:MAG: ABC transporter ATP-binding protein, partial [Candidatus Kariarchaeaceae archaeon]
MRVPFYKQGKLLKSYLGNYRPQIIVLTFLIFINLVLQIANPQIIRYYLDSVTTSNETQKLTNAALLFVGIAIIQQSVYVLSVYVSQDIAWSSTNDLRYNLMDHCMNLDMPFHNKFKPGEMIERVDGDVNKLSNFFSSFSLLVISNILLIIGILVALFVEHLLLGMVFTIFTLVALVGMYIVRNMAIPHWKSARQTESELYGFIEESLYGTEDVKANGSIENINSKFHIYSRNFYDSFNKAIIYSRATVVVAFTVAAIATTLVFASGIPLVEDGTLTLGTLYLVNYYVVLLLNPIFEILRQIQDLQQADASIDRINDLFAETRSLADNGDAGFPKGPVDLRFDDVAFSYIEGEPVLKEISFRLAAGKSLGLVGRTGSGKTTISSLVFRLYDPISGTVKLNEIDSRGIPLKELRKHIAIVTQKVELFQASLRDNVTFFDHSITDDMILEVIEKVGLKPWFDKLPEGLDTEIS